MSTPTDPDGASGPGPDPASNQDAAQAPGTRPVPESGDSAVRGSELLRAVAVMDALRAPDGDAWSALQTHHSLARYLLEETHEVLEAIQQLPAGQDRSARSDADGDDTARSGADGSDVGRSGADGEGPDPGTGALADELGDLLFQILFHARLGEEEDPAWDVDDVARAFVAKMQRRNPHVFGPDRDRALADRGDVEEIIAQWHAVKAAEHAQDATDDTAAVRPDGVDPAWSAGIPAALPALQTAAKVVHRARSAGGLDALEQAAGAAADTPDADQWGGDIARALLDVVILAESRDQDPETALRTLLARVRSRSEG